MQYMCKILFRLDDIKARFISNNKKNIECIIISSLVSSCLTISPGFCTKRLT